MAYSFRTLLSFAVSALVICLILGTSVHFIIIPGLAHSGREGMANAAQSLFFGSPVQWLTLFFLLVVLLLLVERISWQHSLSAVLKAGESPLVNLSAIAPIRQFPAIAARFDEVVRETRQSAVDQGHRAADEVLDQLKDESDSVYGLVTLLMQLMLASGFLGTILGVSHALLESFATLRSVEAKQINSILSHFATSIGAALNPTEVGLFGAIMCGGLMVLTMRLEESNLSQLGRCLHGIASQHMSGDFMNNLTPTQRKLEQVQASENISKPASTSQMHAIDVFSDDPPVSGSKVP